MKRIIRNFGWRINLTQGSWWLFWEGIFLKLRMHHAFDWRGHRFEMANYNLQLFRRATMNW